MAVVWLRLKRKYMNSGMVIDACKMFNISVKMLSKVLLGKKYARGSEKKRKAGLETLGPKECNKKKKPLKAHTAHKDLDDSSSSSSSDEEDNGTRQKMKDQPH